MANEPVRNLKNVNDGKVTSERSSHPLGTTLGTVGGAGVGVAGSIVAGAAAGSAIGPAGAAVGAVIGATLGAGVGHEIAAQVNPQAEDLYWRENYDSRPYVKAGSTYDSYQPAYKYGIDSYSKHAGKSFSDVESDLGQDWNSARGTSTLDWNDATPATRDAYERLSNK